MMIINNLIKVKNFLSDSFYFSKSRKYFQIFIKNLILEVKNDQDKDNGISIIVSPWGFTAVPWYAITIGILLAIKNKKNLNLF